MTTATGDSATNADSARDEQAVPPRVAAWIGGVILVALVALGLSAGSVPHVTSGRALVIGDSLTEDSEAEVRDALSAAGWADPAVDGRGGWSIGLWRKPLVEVASFVRPDVAVVALGTNNCHTRCSQLGPVIDDIVRTLVDAGTKEILWVNVQEANSYPAHSDYVNFEIERAAVRWPQVRVVDLNAAFGPHPEWHIGDLVHFNDVGSQQYGQLIADALAARP